MGAVSHNTLRPEPIFVMITRLPTQTCQRRLAAFVSLLFAFLVIGTTVMPHFHGGKAPESVAAVHTDRHQLSVSAAGCPLCDWLASSYVPAATPLPLRVVPELRAARATPLAASHQFGLAEPVHSPQRGPPSLA